MWEGGQSTDIAFFFFFVVGVKNNLPVFFFFFFFFFLWLGFCFFALIHIVYDDDGFILGLRACLLVLGIYFSGTDL
jgi:hypothetical protein